MIIRYYWIRKLSYNGAYIMVAAMMGGFGWGSDLLTCVNSQVGFKRVEIFNEDWAGRVVVSESDFYI